MNEQIIKFKHRIVDENKNNPIGRRKFSKKLKKDIVLFINEQKISTFNAAQLLGIGNTTMEKWRRDQKPPFQQVKVTTPPRSYKKRKSKTINIDAIKMNQIVLIILTAVLISEVLFLHLSV
jgi:transposase-like protein